MRDPQTGIRAEVSPAAGSGGNGDGAGATDPLDRSHLLRRSSRFPFRALAPGHDPIRLRRKRRVFASFRGIPPLSRRDGHT